MNFDDRLSTVLRQNASGENALSTQYRQLIDLLGRSGSETTDAGLRRRALSRLDALHHALPAGSCAAILREPGIQLTSPALIERLSAQDPAIAAAALGKAQLPHARWARLIPDLPVRARGFLRLRRDLPQDTQRMLDDLGVRDRGLPPPEGEQPHEPVVPSDIGALVKRIADFRATRNGDPSPEAPHLPLDDAETPRRGWPARFGFTTDATGRIDWAEGRGAPMLVGTPLVRTSLRDRMQAHQPIHARMLTLHGPEAVAGDWVIDADPRFTAHGGYFYGYAGMARRPPAMDRSEPCEAASSEGERLRQLLHELRTPMNAIQGFAEIIQQQSFGPAPHEYRALAATIAGDAARMLSGFDALDRLAKLETGAAELEPGESDFAAIVADLVAKLDDTLAPRTAGFAVDAYGAGIVRMNGADAERVAWHLLATIANAMGAGEYLELEFVNDGHTLILNCELPISLTASDDLFAAAAPRAGEALTTGMFGGGFALRLVRAEAAAVGGNLARDGEWLTLSLPLAQPSVQTPATAA